MADEPTDRVRLAHHVVTLDDGTRVGLTVGGQGIPLVFLHGIGMDRQAYLRVLNRLPQLGFLVVGVDAPGHGQTSAPPARDVDFGGRVRMTQRVLDELGIRRALLVGHSMGGRTAAELAALDPTRVLGAVLVDAALGARFDETRERIRSPLQTVIGLSTAVVDTAKDRLGLGPRDRARLALLMVRLARHTVAHPKQFAAAAVAVATADLSSLALEALRSLEVPVAVVHGERDLVVPLESALDAARRANAVLVTLPDAYHSWVLSSPRTFLAIMADVLADARFADALSGSGEHYDDDARVLQLAPPVRALKPVRRGGRPPHAYRVRTADTL